MPEIIFLMGNSATGKDHIYEQLAHDEQLHLKRITMYTTRPMRAGEAEGVEYHFENDDEAARLDKEGKIITVFAPSPDKEMKDLIQNILKS